MLCYYILFLAVFGALFFFFTWYAVYGTEKITVIRNKDDLIDNDFPGGTLIGSNVDKYLHSLVWYSTSGRDSIEHRKPDVYVKKMRHLIQEQEEACDGQKDCIFNNETLGPCGKFDYGFTDKKPCLLLKLSRLHNWEPTAFEEVPDGLPDKMKKHINTSRSCVWVNCEGFDEFDADHIGSIAYYPEAAFHEDYFPQTSNLHPVIALHLKHIKPGFVIRLQCELFAENIFKMPNKFIMAFLYIDE